MKSLKHLALVSLLAVAPMFSVSAAEITAQKKTAIGSLLKVTNAIGMGTQMGEMFAQQMFTVIRQSNPQVPDSAFEIIKDESMKTLKERMPELQGSFVELYDKYYSTEEIQQLNAFYATPVGQKSIRIMPAILQESMARGQQWGVSLAPELQQRIKDRLAKENISLK